MQTPAGMFHAKKRIAIAAALCLASGGVLVSCCGQAWTQIKPKAPARAGKPARAGQEYHIEVNTLPGCFFYGCYQAVRAGNVRVTVAGVRVPVRVEQPAARATVGTAPVPAHLLVAFAPGTARVADAELLMKLKRVLAAGWLVSVCRTDGTFTPYAHAAGLRRALAEHDAEPNVDAGLDTIAAAIDDLRAETGYRVVLVDLGGRSDEKFVRWLASETDRLSPVYVSDGGQAQMPYAPAAAANQFAGAADNMERSYTEGVFHELKLDDAIRHALNDARYDYDLRFLVPAGAAADAPVKLTFLDPATHLPYEFRTDLYFVESRDADGKAYRRGDATPRLKTVEK